MSRDQIYQRSIRIIEEVKERTSARAAIASSTPDETAARVGNEQDESVAGVQADEFQRVHIYRCLAELKQRMLEAGLAPTHVNGAKAADMLPMQRLGHERDIERWRFDPDTD